MDRRGPSPMPGVFFVALLEPLLRAEFPASRPEDAISISMLVETRNSHRGPWIQVSSVSRGATRTGAKPHAVFFNISAKDHETAMKIATFIDDRLSFYAERTCVVPGVGSKNRLIPLGVTPTGVGAGNRYQFRVSANVSLIGAKTTTESGAA